MNYILIALLSLGLSLQDGWLLNYEEAKQKAASENRKILLNFSGSDWCAPCIQMKKEIFSDPVFQDYANTHLVLLNADFPRLKKNQLSPEQKSHNEMLAEKYNPNGLFPYTLLLDKEGNVLKSWEGFPEMKTEEFIKAL